jgi:DNA-binding NarL/FixJ family response regulator
MDIKMPLMDGIEATKKVTSRYPEIKVIVLTMFEEISYFNKMIEAGASGFILKKTTSEELEKAITLVLEGESYFSEEFKNSVNMHLKTKEKDSSSVLTEREQEVLDLICKGFSNVEIAKFLGVSSRTVDGFQAKLFEKTGAKNAPNLVMFAIKNGLVST